MKELCIGKYVLRVATTDCEVRTAQKLRYLSFRAGQPGDGLDRDRFDATCRHILIHDVQTAQLVCCFRMQDFSCGEEIDKSYSAQFYDLSSLRSFRHPLAEIGRFCIRTGCNDPDILRIAWAGIAGFVDRNDIDMLFGCSSFPGISPRKYLGAFGYLFQSHLAPEAWRPGARAGDIIRFTADHQLDYHIKSSNIKGIPPLLRAYLSMGGQVSDHAVIDRDLNSLHVFTGLLIGSIPDARARSLRALSMC